MNCGIVTDSGRMEEYTPIFNKPTVESILAPLGSGLGLDIAKNHTGICIYRDGIVTREGFALDEYDKKDPHAEYRMRLCLRDKLEVVVGGMQFNYCVIEDIYGGENFDTIRKLAALNTVIDELIFSDKVKVNNFFRWAEARWLKYAKTIYKCRTGLNSKVATQEILEYLEDSFYMEHKNDSASVKKDIFFEDICDATGMLLGLSIYVSSNEISCEKEEDVTIKDIQMYYMNDGMSYADTDSRVINEEWLEVQGDYRILERKVIESAKDNPTSVLCMRVPVSRLGKFGLDHGFTFFPDGEGVLVWYLKQK